ARYNIGDRSVLIPRLLIATRRRSRAKAQRQPRHDQKKSWRSSHTRSRLTRMERAGKPGHGRASQKGERAGKIMSHRDKPRQDAVASALKLYRNGAIGFIDWLGLCRSLVWAHGSGLIDHEPDGYSYLGKCMGFKSPSYQCLKTRDIKTPKPGC